MKSDVGDVVVADESGGHHELSETGSFDSVHTSLLEIDALVTQEIDRTGSVLVAGDVEVGEVKLPDVVVIWGAEVGEVSMRVGESDADLDELEGVDVGLESFVVIGRAAVAEILAEDNAGKLGVHGDIRVTVDGVADQRKFGL